MADRVVLHVGTMKSGTTSLQALLFANREALAAQGVLVPGRSWGEQARAVTEVARTGGTDGPLWSALRAEIAAHPGTVVVSMEYLGPLGPLRAGRIVADLGPGTDVVVTVRDLNRTLVSMWQETVQNGRSWAWADYLAAARDERPRRRAPEQGTEAGRTFWRQQDVVGMVRRWSAAGAAGVRVVTVPPPGAPRDALTARFARAVGFDPAGLVPGEAANASLGLTSAVLLQRVNARLEQDGIGAGDGKRLRKRVLAKQVLGPLAAAEPRLGLPVARWVRSYAAGTVRRLAAEASSLEGDWADLTPVEVPGADPSRLAAADLLATAGTAYAALRADLAARGVDGLPAWPGASGEGDAVGALAGLVAHGVRAGVEV